MKPGIYRDMDSETYFGDPCVQPSLTQSIAKIIVNQSPAHAAAEHPRLRPAAEDEDSAEKYDKAKAIGNAAHALMLGRGKDIAILKYNDFRSKGAQEARTEVELRGAVAILEKHMTSAEQMVAAAWSQLKTHQANDAFTNGSGEVAIIWEEDGIWCRSLVDWLRDDMLVVDDYKSGGVSVSPHTLGMRMVDQGWDIQAAMIERGLNALDPDRAGRRKFRFIAQENSAPYALSVAQLSETVLTYGRSKLDYAIKVWRQCITTGEWPAYPKEIVFPDYPAFKQNDWDNRVSQYVEHNERQQSRQPMLTSLMGG